MNIYKAVILFLLTLCLSSCATSPKNWDVENVGDVTNSGSIRYEYNKIENDKFKLEAKGTFGLDNTPDIDRVLEGFKARADKLCLPKTAVYHYQIGMWSYNKKVGNMTFPVDAPKVTGVVSCQ